MKKLSIKDILEFRGKSEKSKKAFATQLKLNKEKKATEGGGDYWITSLSAISKMYKSNDSQFVEDKIDELQQKIGTAKYELTKKMYRRNITILHGYKDFDFKKWQLSKKQRFLTKQQSDSILTIKDLLIQAMPHHLFFSEKDGIKEIGAIWFIAKLNGYKKDELGMFTDILYKYLKTHYSKEYTLNTKYCLAVDVVNNVGISYLQIEKGEINPLLSSTIDEIKRLM